MKEIFFFTKGQKVAMLILLILLVISIVVDVLISTNTKRATSNEAEADAQFKQEVADFFAQMTDVREESYYSPFEERVSIERYKSREKQAELSIFDPNTLDSAGFVKLGLKPYIARNIVNYRKKGGVFATADDFGKIYGIDARQLETLKPYIRIAKTELKKSTEKPKTKEIVPATPIELNTADTTELIQLPAIGSGRAKQIVAYRKRLGGFSSVDQLLEIRYFTPEVLEKIEPYVSVTADSIKPILVNRASVEKLKAHPYINFYQAKAIYELRRKKESLNSIDDLKELAEFTPEQLQKLAPYLDFTKIKYEYKYKKE
ncbi:MAG TPA: helix-hairpin-helix domain-containing protein [Paludibacteraceae bacterium]|nr:helix-hairpin-helix domain-containing protein [Paludibacteraceae bacterium]HOS38015.1 helix-hairpin-helix domain-containing protein [Paludibacteraceae bacterium]HPK20989.1 helix-hairpin-helix domain-containing protein [Paludibacteraceae bacterium]HRU72330.1 helix-hairpin-helix domain-containing protein [Paludibacteraceae bacterium]